MWGRPFKVGRGDFPGALSAEIQDPEVRRIAQRWPDWWDRAGPFVLWAVVDRRQLLELLHS